MRGVDLTAASCRKGAGPDARWSSRAPLAAGLLALALLPGCGGGPAPKPVTFAAAQQSSAPVTIEGIPDHASLRRETGKPVEFTLHEETTSSRIRVAAPPGVEVPANFASASRVVVTGSYDASRRQFNATQVETRVPTREEQPRG